jgi:hypothetical protein
VFRIPLDFTAAYRLVEMALSLVAEGRAEFMIASHNQESIEKATKLMYDMGLPPTESGVYFGQLLGMADPLSYVLGANGYRVSRLRRPVLRVGKVSAIYSMR